MAETPIQWCDHSINPFRARNIKTGKVGHFCVKLSAGCKNCYSSKLQTPHLSGLPFLAENRSKVELFLEEKALQEVARRRKPTKYFWCDMTDMFWEEYPDEWIDRCIGVMAWTAHHTHIVLTKRSKRLMEYSQGLAALTRQQRGVRMARAKGFVVPDDTPGGMDWPLPNVWFMVSCENQETANERVPHLLSTPAAIRGISYEPALGPVDFTKIDYRAQLRETLVAAVRWSAERHGEADVEAQAKEAAGSVPDGDLGPGNNPALNILTGEWFDGWDSGDDGKKIDWLIIGGESGLAARPFDLEWARNTIDQCRAAGVACFFKQAGAKPFGITDRISSRGGSLPDGSPGGFYRCLKDRKGGDLSELPEWANVREFPAVRV